MAATDTVPNPYEEAARTRKAHRLAVVLDALDVSADQAETMTGEQWAQAARTAGVNSPSFLTQAETVSILGSHSRLREAIREHGPRALCSACGSPDTREVIRTRGDAYFLDVACIDCGHVERDFEGGV